MPYQILRVLSSLLLVVFVAAMVSAQTRPRPRPRPTPTPEITDSETPGEPKDIETLKTDTNLVTVPVIATDLSGLYVANLTNEDFSIHEDGVQQQIAFFAQTSAPFHVVLMLDTSASTQDKLSVIQQAAFTFVQQLQAGDRVKVVSFDDEVRDLNEFTNDRATLRAAINKTRAGSGTRMYDAVALALNSLRQIQGRKAIVVFTDGVDWHSTDASFDGTIRWLDEEGVIVYPIRYDTRAATERIAREQSEGISPAVLPTIGVLHPGTGRPAPSGTTPPTFPSDEPMPTTGTSSKTGPLGFPSAQEILRRRREQERDRGTGRAPSPDDLPGTTIPPVNSPGVPPNVGTVTRAPRPSDSITEILDHAYSTADSYLAKLAEKSGGKLLRADTLVSLPDAFAKIAAELRTQYSLGYYPTRKERDDHYRKIKVATTRKDVVIRARPGYLASDSR